MTKITAIIFDLGNVLINWEPHNLYKRFFPNSSEIDRFLEEIQFAEWNAHQDAGRPFQEGVRELSSRFPHYADLIQAYDTYWPESLPSTNPETIKIARDLKQAGWPLFLLSNFSAEKFKIVREQHDFFEIFDKLIISGEHRIIKPNPAIFHLTLDKIDRKAEECLFIDDTSKNIQTAESLGFQVIHYQSPTQLRRELKNLSINGI